jgi:hypothetical protein
LGRGAVDGEGVVCVVDGAPVGEGGFEGRFDFPVLDEVLYELWEGTGFVAHLFGWRWFLVTTWLDRDVQMDSLSANILRVLE